MAPRIAVIGCGAISESFHVPALARNSAIRERLILVDRDARAAIRLANEVGVRRTADNYEDIIDQVDGAVVATPPSSHFAICREFLQNKVHVLCEKPLTECEEEASQLVSIATENQVTLSVNHTRRLFPANIEIKKMLDRRVLGSLDSITYVDGEEFTWPTKTGFYFAGSKPRGVLADRGVHSLDLICWWLNEKPKLVTAKNDSFGGPEGVFEVKLALDTCEIDIQLSWLTKHDNQFEIVGDDGIIAGGIEDWGQVVRTLLSGRQTKKRLRTRARTYNDFAHTLLDNFVQVICGHANPLIPASEVVDSIALVAECYRHATRFELPWIEPPNFDV